MERLGIPILSTSRGSGCAGTSIVFRKHEVPPVLLISQVGGQKYRGQDFLDRQITLQFGGSGSSRGHLTVGGVQRSARWLGARLDSARDFAPVEARTTHNCYQRALITRRPPRAPFSA